MELSLEEGGHPETCYRTDEPGGRCAPGNEPAMKTQGPCDPTSASPIQGSDPGTKSRRWVSESGEGTDGLVSAGDRVSAGLDRAAGQLHDTERT